MKAWGYQRLLKKEKIPSPNELLNRINSSDNCLRDKALVAIVYITAARISEIIPEKFLRKVNYKKEIVNGVIKRVKDNNGNYIMDTIDRIELNYAGIRKEDIAYGKMADGSRYLLFNIQNRKNKDRLRKEIPVVESLDAGFIHIIEQYLATLEYGQPLFNFSKVWAWQIIHKIAGCNCHFLRDIRLTHLVALYHRDGSRLQKYAGWKDLKSATHYIQLDWSDIWS